MNKILKFALPIMILVVAASLASWMVRSGKDPEKREQIQAALLVDTVSPRIMEGAFIVRGQGTVTARTETDLVAEVAGKIVWISDQFVAGGIFEAGEELARIDPSDYETALLAAQADLAAAQATLADEQARSDAAREDFRRLYGESRDPGDLLLRLPQVARAEAAVQAQQAAVQRARRNLERTHVRLPFDGMVRNRAGNLGQYVTTGTMIGTAFAVDRAEVRIALSERDLAFLDIPAAGAGDEFERPVTLSGSVAGRDARWQARLVRTEGVVDEDTRLTWVVAEIEDPYGIQSERRGMPLPVGTFVEAEITGRDAGGLVVVPGQAIHDGNQIYLANEQDMLEVRTVDVARVTPREVYLASTLPADARVITTAIPAPVPGLKLNVREAGDGAMLRILPADELAASGPEDQP